MTEQRQYAAAGVDIAARSKFAAGLPAILAQARRPEVLSDAGPFSGLFRLGDKYRDPVLASSADGVGTKVKLHLALNRLDLCGPDILGHSVNDILACGAEPLFFLDYIAGNGLTSDQKTKLEQDKKKKLKGRALKREQYTRRFVNAIAGPGGKRTAARFA